MNSNPKKLLSGVGFYAVLFLCLAVVGTASYYLLFHNNTQQPEPASSAEVSSASTQPGQAAEVISPAELPKQPKKDAPVSMPERPVEEAVVPIDNTPVVAEAPSLVVSPLQGDVVAAFSVDQLQYDETLEDWRTHDGVDIAATAGTKVLAASAGTVLSVSDDALMGATVVLSHSGGYETTYANLEEHPAVEQGDTVSAGQVIGAVGTTSIAEAAEGPHLHFSVIKDGDAMDPAEYLNS